MTVAGPYASPSWTLLTATGDRRTILLRVHLATRTSGESYGRARRARIAIRIACCCDGSTAPLHRTASGTRGDDEGHGQRRAMGCAHRRRRERKEYRHPGPPGRAAADRGERRGVGGCERRRRRPARGRSSAPAGIATTEPKTSRRRPLYL